MNVYGYRHHCFSQGTPSLLPSIFTPGQFFKKYVASAHEVICEQYVRPSQRKGESEIEPFREIEDLGSDCGSASALKAADLRYKACPCQTTMRMMSVTAKFFIAPVLEAALRGFMRVGSRSGTRAAHHSRRYRTYG